MLHILNFSDRQNLLRLVGGTEYFTIFLLCFDFSSFKFELLSKRPRTMQTLKYKVNLREVDCIHCMQIFHPIHKLRTE